MVLYKKEEHLPVQLKETSFPFSGKCMMSSIKGECLITKFAKPHLPSTAEVGQLRKPQTAAVIACLLVCRRFFQSSSVSVRVGTQ